MNRTPLAKWSEVYERFDPLEEGGQSDKVAPRPNSPADRMIRQLMRPLDPPRFLLLGTTGTGKTTELLRISEACSRKHFVVFLNLVEHFSGVVKDSYALENIRPWEVCFLAGLAIIKAAQSQGYEFDESLLKPIEKSWCQLAKSSGMIDDDRTIDLGGVARSMAVRLSRLIPAVGDAAGSLIESLPESTFAWKVPVGKVLKNVSDQEAPALALLDGVNGLIGKIQGSFRTVLLVIDGLDRIRDPERARELFRFSDLISRLSCRLVVCGPISLHQSGDAPTVRGFDPFLLFNEPVLDQVRPAQKGEGVGFFHEVYRRRIAPDCSELLSESQLDRLAYYSGGRARGFIRLVRAVASEMYDALYDPMTGQPLPEERCPDSVLEEALDQERRRLEAGLNRADIALLESVMSDPDHRLPEGELALKLLNNEHLFPYPNGSEWFYPHPLLTLRLLKLRAP
jgi:hypothetical protein